MDVKTQRKLALSILTFNKAKFNLGIEFPNEINNNADLIDICSFLENYLNKHGIDYFTFNSSSGDFEINNMHITLLLKYLISLSPLKFERLSAILTKCFGFDEYFVTKASHDQGIDIIAVSNGLRELFNLNSNYKYYLFGQCKKYKKEIVDSGEITNLSGSILHFRNGEFAVKDASKVYSKFNIKSHTPTHAFFISGYFFSNNALSLCSNSDIVPLDVIDITIIFLKQIQNGNLKWVSKNNTIVKSRIEDDIKSINVES